MDQHRADDGQKIKPQSADKAPAASFENKKTQRSPKRITQTYLHNAGLYYLERFSASKAHFISVMTRKVKRSCQHHTDQNYEECITLVHKVADRFEESGLLNDQLYADGQARSMRRKGLSRKAILQKMRFKGITADQASSSLNALDRDISNEDDDKDAEIEAALTLARKRKIGPYAVSDQIDMKKALGIFARAGFSYDTAKTVLEMDAENLILR